MTPEEIKQHPYYKLGFQNGQKHNPPKTKWEHETDSWWLKTVEKLNREEHVIHLFYRKRHGEQFRKYLQDRGIPYRRFYFGQSQIVTTDLTHCPCCKQPTPEKHAPLHSESPYIDQLIEEELHD